MLFPSINLIEPLQFYWMRGNIAAAHLGCPLRSNLAKSGCRRCAVQTRPQLRRGFVRRRRPVIDGRSSEEASAGRMRAFESGPAIRRNTPHRRTAIVMCPESKKAPRRGCFLVLCCVFGNLLLAFSPSALPFPGLSRSRRFPAAAPFHRS